MFLLSRALAVRRLVCEGEGVSRTMAGLKMELNIEENESDIQTGLDSHWSVHRRVSEWTKALMADQGQVSGWTYCIRHIR